MSKTEYSITTSHYCEDPETKTLDQCESHGRDHRAYKWTKKIDPRWSEEQVAAYERGYGGPVTSPFRAILNALPDVPPPASVSSPPPGRRVKSCGDQVVVELLRRLDPRGRRRDTVEALIASAIKKHYDAP